MENLITEEFIDETIELAKEIQSPRRNSGANPFAERMGPILNFPESKFFLIRLIDVAFRSTNFDRISTYILRLFHSTEAYKPLFSVTESILVMVSGYGCLSLWFVNSGSEVL
jgi:RHH-type proline utilization regulon transcriptional repressor/proline dehydrogenase/delta 1-pyrroline-5-carboxylate dehydrogenase